MVNIRISVKYTKLNGAVRNIVKQVIVSANELVEAKFLKLEDESSMRNLVILMNENRMKLSDLRKEVEGVLKHIKNERLTEVIENTIMEHYKAMEIVNIYLFGSIFYITITIKNIRVVLQKQSGREMKFSDSEMIQN